MTVFSPEQVSGCNSRSICHCSEVQMICILLILEASNNSDVVYVHMICLLCILFLISS